MKTLYFDLDGTILLDNKQSAKSALTNGRFEQAVRSAGFERLVCVGNFAAIVRYVEELQPEYDALGVLFRMCDGAFRDEEWLRANVVFATEPTNRVAEIEFAGDWWYVDDLAEHYLRVADRSDMLQAHLGGRLCIPESAGDGRDVLQWLAAAANG